LPPTAEPSRERHEETGFGIGGKPRTKRRAEPLVSVSDGRRSAHTIRFEAGLGLYSLPLCLFCVSSSLACPHLPIVRRPAHNWIYEIKHDGYRLMARRDSVGIRLITRRGNDWSDRFPLVVQAAGPV
jgi:ATP-dependent DNA ligase